MWSKAAAYLHGIASTQYFTDGNKRTAWIAANIYVVGGVAFVASTRGSQIEVVCSEAVHGTIFQLSGDPHSPDLEEARALRLALGYTND